MENKNKEGLEYESKFKSRLQASFDEIQKLKEILFENKIKINEIKERIKSCELAEDLKKKNKIYKKEDKKINQYVKSIKSYNETFISKDSESVQAIIDKSDTNYFTGFTF